MSRVVLNGLAALTLLLAAAPAGGAVQEILFKDATGGVLCAAFEWGSLERGTIECAVPSTGSARRYPKQWFLHARGRVVILRPDNGPVGKNRALPYGTELKLGPFRCSMLKAGLRCASRISGHGFQLSRAAQVAF